MDRQHRAASKVTDYRKYHLSGDLDQVLQGRVSGAVTLFENTDTATMSLCPISEDATPEQLQEMLTKQKSNSAKLQQQVEAM